MDRDLALPALVLLDEVGAGTDPVEGGALGTAVIDHFRKRGAHLVATTHYDALKTYASTTEGVESAAFGFDPATFAPTYRLIYGSPGRSLAIEIASRLGMPRRRHRRGARQPDRPRSAARGAPRARGPGAAARSKPSGAPWRRSARTLAENERKLRSREAAREGARAGRAPAPRGEARRSAARRAAEIDAVIEGLKARATVLRDKSGQRSAPAALSTGDAGTARADARAAHRRRAGQGQGRRGRAAGRAGARGAGAGGRSAGRLAGGGRALRARGHRARAPRQARGGGRERQAPARARVPTCA